MGNSPSGLPEAREPARIYFSECGRVRIETRHSRQTFTLPEFLEIVRQRLRQAAAAVRREDFSSQTIYPAEAPRLDSTSRTARAKAEIEPVF